MYFYNLSGINQAHDIVITRSATTVTVELIAKSDGLVLSSASGPCAQRSDKPVPTVETNERLKERLCDMGHKQQDTEREVKRLERRVGDLVVEKEGLRQALVKRENEIKKLKCDVTDLGRNNTRWRTEHAKVGADNQILQRRLDESLIHCREMEGKLSAAEKRVAEFEKMGSATYEQICQCIESLSLMKVMAATTDINTPSDDALERIENLGKF
jgi:chromosome segregation ATPase